MNKVIKGKNSPGFSRIDLEETTTENPFFTGIPNDTRKERLSLPMSVK